MNRKPIRISQPGTSSPRTYPAIGIPLPPRGIGISKEPALAGLIDNCQLRPLYKLRSTDRIAAPGVYCPLMTNVDKHPPGSFCWIELATTDQNAAKGFYTSLFGWAV